MHSIYFELDQELNNLEQFIAFNKQLDVVVKVKLKSKHPKKLKASVQNLKEDLRKIRGKKVLDYNLCIVTLYGRFERFFEDAIVSYLDSLGFLMEEYSDFPDKIIENHANLTSYVIQKLSYPKYVNLKLGDLIGNLHQCINNGKTRLNSIVFADHSSNLRHNTVCEMVSRIGIGNISSRIKFDEDFRGYLEDRFGEETNFSNIKDEVVFEVINDLADRRNDVAHGVINGTPILSQDSLLEYIKIIKLYSKSILEILLESLCKIEAQRCRKLIPHIKIFNNEILCIAQVEGRVSVGDTILAEKPNGRFHKRTIKSMQKDGKNIEFSEVKNGEGVAEIGLKLDGHIKENQKFYF